MIPIKAKLTNYKLYGENTVIDFSQYPDNESILILGNNQDSSGMESNQSGKTTLFGSMLLCLFNKELNKLPLDEAIRWGQDFTELDWTFKNGNDIVRVYRYRGKHNKTDFQFWINGKKPYDEKAATPRNVQKAFIFYLGYADDNAQYFKDFLNTTYLSIDDAESFTGINSDSENRLKLISRFLNLNVIDRCKTFCSKKRLEYSKSLEGSKTVIVSLHDQIREIERTRKRPYDVEIHEVTQELKQTENEITRLKALKKDVEYFNQLLIHKKETEQKIKLLTDTYKNQKLTFQQELNQFQDKINNFEETQNLVNELTLKLNEFPNNVQEQLSLAEQNQSDLLFSIAEKEDTVMSSSKEINELNRMLENSWDCPSCKAPLMFVGNKLEKRETNKIKKDITYFNTLVTKEKNEITNLRTKLTECKAQIKTYSESAQRKHKVEHELKEKQSLLSERDQLSIRVKEHTKTLKRLDKSEQEEVAVLQQSLNGLITRINELQKNNYPIINAVEIELNKQQQILSGIHGLLGKLESEKIGYDLNKKKYNELNKNLSEVELIYKNYLYWEQKYKEIRNRIIDDFLPFFEDEVNYYLKLFEAGLWVDFNTKKLKASARKGEENYTEKFNIRIITDDGNEGPFESFSSGARKRIAICVCFALRKLTLNKGYNNFNFIVLDEIVDNLDKLGLDFFYKVLQKISGLKLVTSHTDYLKGKFKSVITVERVNGVTKIIQ